MSVAILAQASSRPDIMSDVAFFGLLEPLELDPFMWVWRDGERSEEEVAAALRTEEEARRRAARFVEAWRLEAAREWEHTRQRGLWFRHWEGVEGRRMARMDAEARRVEEKMRKAAAAAQWQRASGLAAKRSQQRCFLILRCARRAPRGVPDRCAHDFLYQSWSAEHHRHHHHHVVK